VTKCDQNLMIRLWSLYYLSDSLSSCNVNSPTCKPFPHAAQHERRELTCSYIGIAAWIHTSILTCEYGGKPYCLLAGKKPSFYASMEVCQHGDKTPSPQANRKPYQW